MPISSKPLFSVRHLTTAASLLLSVKRRARRVYFLRAISLRPETLFDTRPEGSEFRAALTGYWEARFASPIPLAKLQPIAAALWSGKQTPHLDSIVNAKNPAQMESAIATLVTHVADEIGSRRLPHHAPWPARKAGTLSDSPAAPCRTTSDLAQLVAQGAVFSTIYADPPWAYGNVASRGAAVNHYPTMTVDAICREPVRELAAPDSHLHLWTTNGFLREALTVIDAWGFRFKSCLVWVKPQMGLGNYWRVSHEFMLLGVRGNLRFRDHSVKSWLEAPRTVHSRKPELVRHLIERVSPGPYLELYGRRLIHSRAWTVYGNELPGGLP